MPLGNRIKARRSEAGLSQAELAETTGGAERQINRDENGRVTHRLDALAHIAHAFKTSLDALLTRTHLRTITSHINGL